MQEAAVLSIILLFLRLLRLQLILRHGFYQAVRSTLLVPDAESGCLNACVHAIAFQTESQVPVGLNNEGADQRRGSAGLLSEGGGPCLRLKTTRRRRRRRKTSDLFLPLCELRTALPHNSGLWSEQYLHMRPAHKVNSLWDSLFTAHRLSVAALW